MPLSEADLAMRPTMIGASEAAMVVGVHPSKSALTPYWRKIGTLVEEPMDSEPIYWGNAIEDAICERYRQEHDLIVSDLASSPTIRSEKYPWMGCTPDRIVQPSVLPAPIWGLEVKTACHADQVRRFGKVGDQIPEEYLIQCHWSMIVMGFERWDLAVLLGTWHGFQYREYELHADADLHKRLIEIGDIFWHEHVEKRVEPPPQGFVSDSAILRKLYPVDTTAIMPADADTTDMAKEYAYAMREEAAGAKRVRLAQQALMMRLRTSEGLEGPGFKITWKKGKKARTWRKSGSLFTERKSDG